MSANIPICSKLEDLDKVTNTAEKAYSEYFNFVIKELKIDKNKNKELANNYYDLDAKIKKLDKSIRSKKIWRWFLIIFFIFPFVLLTKQVKQQNETLTDLNKEFERYHSLLNEQLKDFYSYFSSKKIYDNVLNKCCEDFYFEKNINLQNNSTWDELLVDFPINKERSVVNLITGQIFNHPFLLFKRKAQEWIDVPYSSSASISYRDSNGHMQTEIVTATVLWPYPVYNINNFFAFKSNVAPKLEFENQNRLKNTHKIKSFYKNTNSSHMDNEEFDVLFPCERNDEVQFRLLFTVLTQEKFVKLLSENDFFKMFKNGLYTCVFYPNASSSGGIKRPNTGSITPSKNLDYSFDRVRSNESYDLDQFKEDKIEQINSFLTDFSVMQMPFANMPALIREPYVEKSKSSSKHNSCFQDMVFANKAFAAYSSKSKYKTDVILNTKLISTAKYKKNNINISEVTVNYFVPVPKVIPKMAVGVHGSRMVYITVQDFIPHKDTLFLLQIDNLPTEYDNHFNDDGVLCFGNYYKLFNKQPNEQIVKKELEKFKK